MGGSAAWSYPGSWLLAFAIEYRAVSSRQRARKSMSESGSHPSSVAPEGEAAARGPAHAHEATAREATAQLYRVWSVPGGRFPWLTLLVVLASVTVTVLAHLSPESTYERLYATGWELWAEWRWWGVLSSVFIHGGAIHLLFNVYWIWLFGRLTSRNPK
jgi:membrane associated rhomboid family serine protease